MADRYCIWLVTLAIAAGLRPAQCRTITVGPPPGCEHAGIQKAADQAKPGDVVLVKPGTYHGQVRLQCEGTPWAPITIRAEKRGASVLQGTHANAKKLNLAKQENGSGFFIIPGARHIVLEGFEIRGFYADGVLIHGDSVTVRNCHIHNNGNHTLESPYGYNGVFSAGSSHDNVYEGNVIHHNGRIGRAVQHDHGLYLCGNRAKIVNNLIYSNAGFGVHVAGYSAADGYIIVNNTICFHMRGSGIALWKAKKSGSVRNCAIRNNIIAFNAWYGIDFVGDDGHVVSHNIIFGNGQLKALPGSPGYDGRWQKELRQFGDERGWFFAYDKGCFTASDNLNVDPRFTDPTGQDFRPRVTSVAIDRGTGDGAPQTDINGVSRPQGKGVDIGAYEAPEPPAA